MSRNELDESFGEIDNEDLDDIFDYKNEKQSNLPKKASVIKQKEEVVNDSKKTGSSLLPSIKNDSGQQKAYMNQEVANYSSDSKAKISSKNSLNNVSRDSYKEDLYPRSQSKLGKSAAVKKEVDELEELVSENNSLRVIPQDKNFFPKSPTIKKISLKSKPEELEEELEEIRTVEGGKNVTPILSIPNQRKSQQSKQEIPIPKKNESEDEYKFDEEDVNDLGEEELEEIKDDKNNKNEKQSDQYDDDFDKTYDDEEEEELPIVNSKMPQNTGTKGRSIQQTEPVSEKKSSIKAGQRDLKIQKNDEKEERQLSASSKKYQTATPPNNKVTGKILSKAKPVLDPNTKGYYSKKYDHLTKDLDLQYVTEKEIINENHMLREALKEMNDELSTLAERESMRSLKLTNGGTGFTLVLVEKEIKNNKATIKMIDEEEEEISKRLAVVSRPGYLNILTKEIAEKKELIKRTAKEIKEFDHDNSKSGKELYSLDMQKKGVPDMVKRFHEIENEIYLIQERTAEIKRKNEETLDMMKENTGSLNENEERERKINIIAEKYHLESNSPKSLKGKALILEVKRREDFLPLLIKKNEKFISNEEKEIESLKSLLEDKKRNLKTVEKTIQEQVEELEALLKEVEDNTENRSKDYRLIDNIKRLMNRQTDMDSAYGEADQSKTNSFTNNNSSTTNSFMKNPSSRGEESKPVLLKVKKSPISKSSDEKVSNKPKKEDPAVSKTPGPQSKKVNEESSRENLYKPNFTKKKDGGTQNPNRIEEESLEQTADFGKENLNIEKKIEKKNEKSAPLGMNGQAKGAGLHREEKKESLEKEKSENKFSSSGKENIGLSGGGGGYGVGSAGGGAGGEGMSKGPTTDSNQGGSAMSKPKLFNFSKNKAGEKNTGSGLKLPPDTEESKVEEKKSPNVYQEPSDKKSSNIYQESSDKKPATVYQESSDKKPTTLYQETSSSEKKGTGSSLIKRSNQEQGTFDEKKNLDSYNNQSPFQSKKDDNKSNSLPNRQQIGQNLGVSQEQKNSFNIETPESNEKSFNFNSRRAKPKNDDVQQTNQKGEETMPSINNTMSRRNRNQIGNNTQLGENNEENDKFVEKNDEFIPTIATGASRRNMKTFKKDQDDDMSNSGLSTGNVSGFAGRQTNTYSITQDNKINKANGYDIGESNTISNITTTEDTSTIGTISGIGSRRNQKIFRKEDPPDQDKQSFVIPELTEKKENVNSNNGLTLNNNKWDNENKNELDLNTNDNSKRKSPFLSNFDNKPKEEGGYKLNDPFVKKQETNTNGLPPRKRNIFDDKTDFNIPEIGNVENKKETIEPRKRNIFGDNPSNKETFGKKQALDNNADDDIFEKSIIDSGKLNFLQEEPKKTRTFTAEPDFLEIDKVKKEPVEGGARASPFKINAGTTKQDNTKEREKQLASKAENGGNDVFGDFDFF